MIGVCPFHVLSVVCVHQAELAPLDVDRQGRRPKLLPAVGARRQHRLQPTLWGTGSIRGSLGRLGRRHVPWTELAPLDVDRQGRRPKLLPAVGARRQHRLQPTLWGTGSIRRSLGRLGRRHVPWTKLAPLDVYRQGRRPKLLPAVGARRQHRL